jgi:LEA14-like dessication related protein
MRRATRAASFLLLLAAACGGPRVRTSVPLDPPVLRIDAFLPTGMDADGVTLQLAGRIENPNAIALTVSHVDYALELDGRPSGGGRVTSDLRLPARDAVPLLVPTRLRWAQVPDLVTLLATRTAVPIRVSGVSVVPGAGALPYEARGELVLPRLPRVALAGTTLRESNLLQTTVELRLEIENPNDFPLPEGRFAYDLSLSGVSVARAASYTLGGIPARGRTTVVIPARFSTVGAAAGVLSGALGGRGELALTGRAGFGGLEVRLDARAPLLSR